ncbi:MAG: VCBS repeat-containing protein [Flavobacteriaceae bacterium]
MLFKKLLFFSFITFILSCGEKEEVLFSKLSNSITKIDFQNKIQSNVNLNILNYIYYYNGAGVASADFNNDGLIDLYFTANQSEDKLYLNKGQFTFQDITKEAQIDNAENWTNGVSIVDINQDGWMDIYICKTGDYLSIKGKNLLYVNQGLQKNNIPIFKEEASKYNLDFIGFSTQASFFDYDLDGDLDLYLLNHSTNPNQNYGKGSARTLPNKESGDKLFENKNGIFEDVSEISGIFQSKISYGLGVSTSDINNDGYTDLYISNDFFENDYLYINQGNKTFKEVIHTENPPLGHTTHYSMGNDIADINNDGFTDIISVDMLPEDLKTYKTSGTEFNYQNYINYIKNGYAYQYMQNTLQLNNGNGSFSETGYLSGISATEWSWSPLIADFDNDGLNDLYITNGIKGATNDMDFINFIANDQIQKTLGATMTEKEMEFIKKIPEKKTSNYIFRNKGNNEFENTTKSWTSPLPSFSNGAAYADLDNDGDLDLIVNNVNEPAFILENKLNERFKKRSFLKINFEGNAPNRFGIGAKVIVFSGNKKLIKENYTTRGYLSSVAPEVHFGLDTLQKIDSLHIIWPNHAFETLKNIIPKQTLKVTQNKAKGNYYKTFKNKATTLLTQVDAPFEYRHVENSNIEFNRDPLTPFSTANEGPSVSIVDTNNDGLEDVFLSGAKGQASQLFIQKKEGLFALQQETLFEEDAINEDVSHVFFDATTNGYKDLIVVSGGNEFITGKAVTPRLYLNKGGVFQKDTTQFTNVFVNASKVTAIDLDNDSNLDICITSNGIPQKFGHTPQQYLFKNDGKGNFTDITKEFGQEFSDIGNCNDIFWIDINNDSFTDAIVVGDWMPVSLFINDGKRLTLQKNNGLDASNGFWNSVKAADFDHDGDIDLVAGNWGLNSRLQASKKEPITLYKMDFDGNSSEETVVTYFYQGTETTVASKEELAKQMPFINKKYLSYKEFANATIAEVFSAEKLQKSLQKKVFELATCYFENTGNNSFKKHRLPFGAQISSVNDIWIEDFNNDHNLDLLLVGNNFEISTQLSRLDASRGTLLLNDGKANFSEKKEETFTLSGACRNIEKLTMKGESYFIVVRNNNNPIFLKKKN